MPAAGRFNERLVLSLASCPTCILMDDELNILPTSSHVARIVPVPLADDGTPDVPSASAASAAELKELIASLADTQVRMGDRGFGAQGLENPKVIGCQRGMCWACELYVSSEAEREALSLLHAACSLQARWCALRASY